MQSDDILSIDVGSTHGRDSSGRRLLPVMLKDVAGLVPGAYKGRGRGNKVCLFCLYINAILSQSVRILLTLDGFSF